MALVRRRWGLLLLIACVVGFGSGVVGHAWRSSAVEPKVQITRAEGLAAHAVGGPGQPIVPATTSPRAGTAGGGTAQSAAAAGTAAPRSVPPVVGRVTALEGDVLTVHAFNDDVSVRIGGDTAIVRTGRGALAGIKPGDGVIISGQRSEDGATLNAVKVVTAPDDLIRALDADAGLGGASESVVPGGGQADLQRPSANGTVQRVDDTDVQVTTAEGPLKVHVARDTLLLRLVRATHADLRQGVRVFITVDQGAGSLSAARVVRLLEPEQTGTGAP